MGKSILVLAAGMGSRYGGLKQMDGVGPHQETIMDFTIHDAIESGFDQAVFVIRRDFEDAFRQKVVRKYEGKIQVDIVFQELDAFVPSELDIQHRQKPWGTGHAVLVAKDLIQDPFIVVNADDFYGKHAIQTIGAFLDERVSPSHYAMVGYPLALTLSSNGTVSRGVCHLGAGGQLSHIVETEKIQRTDDGIVYGDPVQGKLEEEVKVSMNLWGLHPSIFDRLDRKFDNFIRTCFQEEKSEIYLPFVIDEALQAGEIQVDVLPTDSRWYGVTYKDDLPDVQKGIASLMKEGVYPNPLWG